MFRGIFEGVRGCLGRFWGCFRGGLGSFEGVLEVVWRCIGVLIGV